MLSSSVIVEPEARPPPRQRNHLRGAMVWEELHPHLEMLTGMSLSYNLSAGSGPTDGSPSSPPLPQDWRPIRDNPWRGIPPVCTSNEFVDPHCVSTRVRPG